LGKPFDHRHDSPVANPMFDEAGCERQKSRGHHAKNVTHVSALLMSGDQNTGLDKS
jgi:hypothetical protein